MRIIVEKKIKVKFFRRARTRVINGGECQINFPFPRIASLPVNRKISKLKPIVAILRKIHYAANIITSVLSLFLSQKSTGEQAQRYKKEIAADERKEKKKGNFIAMTIVKKISSSTRPT